MRLRTWVSALALALALVGWLPLAQPSSPATVHAAGALTWAYKSFTIAPFTDSELLHSGPALQQLAAVGANTVTLVPTWYMSSEFDSAIFATGSTATDASMISAIQQARSLGLQVVIKPHVDIQNGLWRAYINPTNPTQWFTNYSALINHYADMATAQGATALCVGAELITMSTNPANTAQWRALIGGVRQRFAGKLTYSANWGSGPFGEEFTHIPFWDALDYLGISAYFSLASTTTPTVAQLNASWTNWQTTKVLPFQQQVGKPIVFTEVGYRSADGAAEQPWDWWDASPFDGQEQADLYEAMFESWGQNANFAGAAFWFWNTNTGVSPTSTDYEIQNKPAQSTVSSWFHAASTAPISLLSQPVRLLDTRGTGGPVVPGADRCFTVAGQAGIPGDAAGVVLNLTATGQTGRGWLTLYPKGQTVPSTSTLDFDTSQHALANGAVARLGTGDQVCVASAQATSQVIVDATGYVPASAQGLTLLSSPARLLDTRSTGGAVQPGADRCFNVAGQVGIPADAAGALFNVTTVGYASNGWLTLYPAGSALPATSTLNFDTHAWAIANNALLKVGTNGQVCINAGQSAPQAIVDVVGYLTPAGATALPLQAQPQRVVDTRAGGGPVVPGADRCFTIAGQGGVPVGASGVVANITSVGSTGPGWLTLYPAGQSLPATSTLNFDSTAYAIANGAIIRLGSAGQACVDAGQTSAHVILDITAYLP